MRRFYTFGVTFLVLFVLFFGCKREKPILTFAVGGAPSEVVYWEELVKDFEGVTGINVKVLRQPTDTDQRRQGLVIPLKGKQKDPDLFLMDVVWVSQFAASGWLQPFDTYLAGDTTILGAFFEGVIEQVDKYKGNIISFPIYIDGGLLYYRKDILEKYQLEVPKTWEELVKTAKLVQKQERKENSQFYGFVWQGAQYEGLVCNFLEFLSSNGGKMVDESGNFTMATPENTTALKFMHDLIHSYAISPPNTFTEMKEEEVRTSFQRGNALFERNWPYAWSLHQGEDSPIKDKVGIAPLPRFEGKECASTLGGWHIGLSRYSDMKEEAWEFIKFVTSYEAQKKLALNLGWNPGRKDIYDDNEVREALPHFEILKKIFKNAVARPNLPYYSQVSEVIQRELNASIAGKLEPKEALSNAQDRIVEIIQVYEQ